MQILIKLKLLKNKKLLDVYHFNNFTQYITLQKKKKIQILEEIKVEIYIAYLLLKIKFQLN